MELHQDVFRVMDFELEIVFFLFHFFNCQIELWISIKSWTKKTWIHLKNVFKRIVWKVRGVNICFNVVVWGDCKMIFGILCFCLDFFKSSLKLFIQSNVDELFMIGGWNWWKLHTVNLKDHWEYWWMKNLCMKNYNKMQF